MGGVTPRLRLVEPPEEEPARSDADGEDQGEDGIEDHAPSEPKPSLDQAFRTWSPYVAAIGLRLLGRPDEVDDLVQDVFIEAHKGYDSIKDSKAVKGWLARVTVRAAHRKLTWRRRWSFLGIGRDFDYALLPAQGASPEEGTLLALVYGALDRLPAEQRVAWTLRHVEGERLDQVASLCGCSLATAKRRIAAAHAAIREAVDDG
jgi:RNA polymerase sigma-70 factor (ECF subfamily)